MIWTEQKPLVCLAPMENYTDSAFRQVVRSVATDVVLFTEFVSVDGLKFNPEAVSKKYRFKENENPLVVQLFGNNPDHFVNAIKLLSKNNISGIDINMGCPAQKVVKCQFGAALLKDPELAWGIAEACVKASSVPITVKTRLGWDNKEEIISFAQGFDKRGVSAITIHGRTFKQGFAGQADWDPIYQVKEKVKMKVIGNGDVDSGESALSKIGNLDGVMIGRASFGNPWLLQEAYTALKNNSFESAPVSFQEKIPVMIKHCQLLCELKGEKRGMLEMRKHLASYVKSFEGAREIRGKLVRVEKITDVEEILKPLR